MCTENRSVVRVAPSPKAVKMLVLRALVCACFLFCVFLCFDIKSQSTNHNVGEAMKINCPPTPHSCRVWFWFWSVSNINEMSVPRRANTVNKSNLQCSLPQRWNGHLRWRRRNHLRTPLHFLAGPTTPSARPLPPRPASGATTWAHETPTSPPPDPPPPSPRIRAPQRPGWGA